MHKEQLQKYAKHFDILLPQNIEVFLLLVTLNQKIENQEIEDPFTQRDFDEAVDDVAEILQRDQSIQKETISKKLSQYYYTTLKKGGIYRYQLSVFAKDFIRLIQSEIQPIFGNLELIHTFQRTLPLIESDLESGIKFEYWFNNHFIPSKRIILSHTENLQRLVDEKTFTLRDILRANIENTKELINNFIGVFEQLGKQTIGLTQTLTYKQGLLDKIKEAEANFLDNKEAWDKYFRIRKEVELFFENIDSRVLSINDRIQTSTSRLKTLYDTLRYKQLFKLKIEKFLLYLLKNSTTDKEGTIFLPENIKKKPLPLFKDKFVYIRHYNFADVVPRDVPELEEDAEFKKIKEDQNMGMLNRQESISKWIDSINTDFENGQDIIFEDWFKSIYKQEQNLEVPIDVCFGLIQKHNKSKTSELIIDNKHPINAKEDLTIWKLKIQHSNS